MSEDITNQITPRLFHIVRHGDESGVSGLGRVLDGILWVNGQVTVMWRTDLDPKKVGMSSITTFNNYRAFEDIHINSHPTNNTEIIWVDDEIVECRKEIADIKEKFTKKSDKLKDVNKELRDLKEVCDPDGELSKSAISDMLGG